MTDAKNEWVAEMPPLMHDREWPYNEHKLCHSDKVRALVTKANAELTAARDRIAELEERLQISPQGDDKIDELSDACEQLRVRCSRLGKANELASKVVDAARELVSYDWECRLDDEKTSYSAREDSSRLRCAVNSYDRCMRGVL